MATIITKNSSTASSVPAAGSLVQGELAVNVTDKKLYTKDSGGNVVKVVGSLGNQEANAVAITGGTITGLGTPSAASDASTKGYVDGLISTGASNAAAAADSASAAATSATNAATSETNAATSATNASTSATAANSAKVAAEAARDATLSAYDNFDDRYLGTKTSDPTLDNDGNALVAGTLYFSSTENIMKLYTGSAWVAAYVSGANYVTLAGTETITNKTINFANNTLTGVASTSTSQTLTNKTIEAGTFTNGYTEETVTANTSTAYTIDLANGSVQILTLTGNCTYTFPTATAGRSFLLVQKQDGTGSRTVTWPAAVKWPASTAPTITSTASKADIFAFTSDGTNWFGRVIGQNYL